MVVLISTTVISCTQAFFIIDRLKNVVGLTQQQKIEIVQEVKKFIPSCPIEIKKDE